MLVLPVIVLFYFNHSKHDWLSFCPIKYTRIVTNTVWILGLGDLVHYNCFQVNLFYNTMFATIICTSLYKWRLQNSWFAKLLETLVLPHCILWSRMRRWMLKCILKSSKNISRSQWGRLVVQSLYRDVRIIVANPASNKILHDKKWYRMKWWPREKLCSLKQWHNTSWHPTIRLLLMPSLKYSWYTSKQQNLI